ncbi:MAG: beta-N-acetylhexosaminidase [Chloroflexota bacterium]
MTPHSSMATIFIVCCLTVAACGGPQATEPTVGPPTATPSNTPTATPSSTPTAMPYRTPTATPSSTDTPAPTAAWTPTPVDLVPTATQASTLEGRVEALLSRMTLEQKVGQLFVVWFEGAEYSDALDRMIRELNVGGIVLFGPNVGSAEEVTTLINAAQATAAQAGAGIPLIVATDHEGGSVNRFADGLTRFPSSMAVAATGSLENARAQAGVMAEELTALGINMNLAPVVDVNTNPDNPVIGVRSFGSDPHTVADFGAVMIEELQQHGLVATAKHFPGHGDTAVDSHDALPVLPHDRQRLDEVELVPFRAAIDAGVDAVMTAHVALSAVDPTSDLPATLSSVVLTDLLRGELGFDGLVATDSLGMRALDETVGLADASAMAFQAGADLLMFGRDAGRNPGEQTLAYQNVLALVRDGTVSRERLDASVHRILLVKARRGLLDWQPASLVELPRRVRTAEHLAVAEALAEQSVTLVRNDGHLLPVAADRRVLLVYPESQAQVMPALAEVGAQAHPMRVSQDPGQEEITDVVSAAEAADVILVVTADAREHPGQIALVQAIGHLPTVVLAVRSPYDLLGFPSQSTYVTTYGDVPVSFNAAAGVLFGQLQPSGRLPVSLPDLFPEGHGLQGF